ncbi:FecR domain-containing protein [Paraburkholderia hospita]|uniref:FecR domain-containing protein n=1 Tax=Paraburkholderia hospita TaxID=169430 RepID=UPI0002715879|nr:FecR domain-containing protein [Paraburkholderia hospita]EUC20545.1 FecR protein [Burkholderia sp. BT03]SKD06928.1 FecR family protein [Paraburkholderia hospita]
MTVAVPSNTPRALSWAARRAPGIIAFLVAASGLLPASSNAQTSNAHATAATAIYVTRPGDTLYDVADHYLRDPRDWAVLRKLNHVADPLHLQPGVQLRLPVALLKQEPRSARVVAVSGPAGHAFRQNPFAPVTVGMVLVEGDRVQTGHNGFVTLELDDDSHVSVPQDSTIEIGALRQTVLTGAKDRVIDLKRGEVDSEVNHATKKDDRFQIRSPSVVAGVRGTRFRVSYDGDEQSTAVAVLDGAVGVDAARMRPRAPGVPLQASTQLIGAHFGSVTRSTGGVGGPVALLPAPALVNPGKVQDDKDLAFDLVPDANARAYRVQIARDADLFDLIRDQRVNVPHATFGDLPDGNYFVRISSIDGMGLEGLPHIYAFERRQFGLDVSAGLRAGSRDFEFRWLASRTGVETRFRFVLATTADLREPLVDRTDLAAGQIVVSDLPPGDYYWTVIAEQFDNGRLYQKGSAIRSFTLAR